MRRRDPPDPAACFCPPSSQAVAHSWGREASTDAPASALPFALALARTGEVKLRGCVLEASVGCCGLSSDRSPDAEPDALPCAFTRFGLLSGCDGVVSGVDWG